MNETDSVKNLTQHIRTLYALIAVLTIAFIVLAVLVWRRSPHEILTSELRDLSFQMAQQSISAEQEAANKRDREQALEGRIAEAKAIVLCEHKVSWGKTECKVTRILKHESGFPLPCSVGSPMPHHDRKVERDLPPGEGEITFFTGDSFNTSSLSLVINNRLVTDYYLDPSRPSNDPYVRREFTVEQVVEMIGTANKVPEGIVTNVPNLQH